MSNPTNKVGMSSLPLARVLAGILPFAAAATPAVVVAGVATNTVTITAATGQIEANTANNTATDTDVVFAALFADPDDAAGISGASGSEDVTNVLDGDTINGVPVTLNDVEIEVLTPATPINAGDPVPVIDPASGQVDVPAGTPAGTYVITYQICETANKPAKPNRRTNNAGKFNSCTTYYSRSGSLVWSFFH